MENIIQISHLTHYFNNRQKALNNIHIHVPTGSIYGFLGPNGAGKTTTLRLLLGLLQKQEGEISILGQKFETNRTKILSQIGSLIEYPSIYGELTAYENLLVWQKIYQCPKNKITELLQLVGLAATGQKKTSNFSLGMKQRLGLAIALLNNPRVLILDEPTNGLDPNGIIEIRELLIKLNSEQGITIVISSHLLSEIEKLVTHIGLINKGTMLFEGTLNELQFKQKKASIVVADTSNNIQAMEILRENYLIILTENKIHLQLETDEEIGVIVYLLTQHNLAIYEIYRKIEDLETIFMRYIQ